jgi:hypothetical protein
LASGVSFGGGGDRRHGKQQVSVAVVMAGVNSHEGMRRVVEGLRRWTSLTAHACSGSNRNQMGFFLYLNRRADVLDQAAEEVSARKIVAEALGTACKCFSTHSVVYANLEGEDDQYPAGPSNMFYAIFGDGGGGGGTSDGGGGGGSGGGGVLPLRTTSGGGGGRGGVPWDSMFWMEPDVSPIRGGWLDAVGLGHFPQRYFAVKTPVDDSQDSAYVPCNQADTREWQPSGAVYADAQVPGGFWLRGTILRDGYLDRNVAEKTSGAAPTPGAVGGHAEVGWALFTHVTVQSEHQMTASTTPSI